MLSLWKTNENRTNFVPPEFKGKLYYYFPFRRQTYIMLWKNSNLIPLEDKNSSAHIFPPEYKVKYYS